MAEKMTKEQEKQYLSRVAEANKKISKAVCLIQSANDDLDYVFEQTDWDGMIMFDIEKAIKYLAYVIASFNLWDEDLDAEK